MQKPLPQGPFYHTGFRIFRISYSSFKQVYKGIFPLSDEAAEIVVNELINNFIEIYDQDLGQSMLKITDTSYEITIFSQKESRLFTIGFDYLEERGKSNFSSSLYYLQVSFIA